MPWTYHTWIILRTYWKEFQNIIKNIKHDLNYWITVIYVLENIVYNQLMFFSTFRWSVLYCGMITWETHKLGDIVEWLTVEWHMLYCFGWRRDISWENENVVISEWMKSKAQYFGWQVLLYATCQFSSFAVECLRINCNKYWRKLF